MERKDVWKWGLLAVLVAGSLHLALPPEKINLGIDLMGGTSFVVEIDASEIERDIRRRADGEMTEKMFQSEMENRLRDAQERALTVLANRINELGTREPIIYPERGSQRIVIQLPGASDQERREAEEIIRRVAFLSFHIVHKDSTSLSQRLMDERMALPGYRIVDFDGQPYYERDPGSQAGAMPDPRRMFPDGKAPLNHVFLLHKNFMEKAQRELYSPICVRQIHEFTGDLLTDARVELTPLGEPYVSIEFDGRGARLFHDVTRDYGPGGLRNRDSQVGYRLAIALDHVVHSAPEIKDAIAGGRAQITGSFPSDEAYKLAMVLRTGALPAPVKIAERRQVDPALGADAVRKGLLSILVAGLAVVVFMLLFYRLSGMVADIALILNLALLPLGMVLVSGFLGVFLGTRAGGNPFALPVLTLPGIAGILLTIGMAVDANVLIYERFREEFKQGKRFWSAISAGYDRAFVTILDANLTTLLTGVILFVFGSGAIRGFAITLCAGILVSMFTSLVVTRMFFKLIGSGTKLKTLSMGTLFRETAIDFMARRKTAALVSLVVIAASWGLLLTRGLQNPAAVMGIDFVSGSSVTLSFDTEHRPDVESLRRALEQKGVSGPQIQYQREMNEDTEFLVVNTAFVEGAEKTEVRDLLVEAFPEARFAVQEQSDIAPQIGAQMKWQALKAIVIALAGIVLYISMRFQFGFATGAIVALVHDVLATAGIYVLLGGKISLPVVAALLTIVGYSVNDTIVIFDRIREDLRLVRNRSFVDICNLSVNQTLSRTLLTSFTTLLATGLLLWLGGGAIRDFALTLCIGVVVGTYSSIFIATPVMLWWQKDKKPEFGATAGGGAGK
jgi:SecD/SecF fusion protein